MTAVYAEFFTTFFLVFFGAGAVSIGSLTGGVVGTSEIALVFGLVVFLNLWLFGPISGAHSNPVISLALWIQEEITGDQLVAYWVAQFAGGIMASLALLFFFQSDAAPLTLPSSGVTIYQALGMEVLLTFILVLVVLLHPPAIDPTTRFSLSVSVAGVYALGVFTGLHISGGSMNPARSFGPALVMFDFESVWIYLVAPFAGSILAVLLKRSAFRSEL